MKRRLDMNTNTNNIQGRKSATKVAESLNIPDARQDIHHESKGINPSYENDQENRRAAMNIATTGSKSAPTNPEAIQNIHNNGVTQAYRMNYPPRMETTSNYPGCNVLTSGYNVNGHREQIIEPDAPNNNDTDRYNFPPHTYNSPQDTGPMTPIIITQMVHKTVQQERPSIPSLSQQVTSINRPQYNQPKNRNPDRKHVTVQDRKRNGQSRNSSTRSDVSGIDSTNHNK
ncbi:unnamed protein product [Mytilus coruscus]|uniref:Uncharacterized protein n=1 Tax=Mytilus coruscus TaxID=42192 RepID=A0A6J8DYT1_MYTCO|nr:unnamed protein product [Mytilus coruscus]